jgi:hypothetical protein
MNGIYYHCFCVNDYEDRVLKTFKKIKISGLLDQIDCVKLVCVGKPSQQIKDLPKVEIILTDGFCKDEAITLNYIYNNNIYDNVLYMHSKGVTVLGDKKNVNYWVDYMEYFCIEKYQDRLKELEQYNATGVNLQYHYNFKSSLLYSGNFWWATNKHIKTLAPCNESNRFLAEMWVCSNTQGKYNCIHHSHVDHYTHEYTRDSYTKELSII